MIAGATDMHVSMLLLSFLVGLITSGGCRDPDTVRFATFNSSLSRDVPGALIAALEQPDDAQAKAVAEIIQRVRPDVLVLQGLDHYESYDPDGRAIELLQRNYFAISQGGAEPIQYEHVYLVPSNTGTPADRDQDEAFPGKGAFAILSRHPIVSEKVRTFSKLPWGHLPVNTIPKESDERESLEALPISTGGHVLAPVRIGDRTVHVLAANPRMPPIEDPGQIGARRNHDEIELLKIIADVQNQVVGLAAVDDAGVSGTCLQEEHTRCWHSAHRCGSTSRSLSWAG
jgi:3-phytase